MKQVDIPELLDTDSGTEEEIANALTDLRGINRHYGGISTMEAMVERVSKETGERSFTLLEVAAGSGYVPQSAQQALSERGIQIHVTLLDRAQSHLPPGNGGKSTGAHITTVVGDALGLPFPDSSFDLVDCNLFAHHLLPDTLIQFVSEGLRVCRAAVLINDLVRSPIHLALVYAGCPSFRSRVTRHDAPVSVRRAYTEKEMRTLLKKTNAARVDIERHYLFRMGVFVWKRPLPV